jgi:TPR repeat protein
MRYAVLSALALMAVAAPGIARAQAEAGPRGNIVLAGGTDIVRILPPEANAPPPPLPETKPEPKVALPSPPPAPPPSPPTVDKRPELPAQQGRFLTVQVKRGFTQTDQTRPWIGINADSIDRPLAISFGLREANGVMILDAYAGSPAAQAGIKAGDIVVNMNGIAVGDTATFRQRLLAVAPGNEATFEIWRYLPDGTDFITTLRSLAEQGNASVTYRLGHMYNRGSGVPRDEAEAARWFRLASNSGNSAAMAELALMLLDGRGVERNTPEGLSLLKTAADSGNVAALWQYGQVMQAGKYVTRDFAAAAQVYQRAADAGYAPAMVSLAIMHANGMGMPRNYPQAARLYEKAAVQNNTAALVNLGVLYQYGNGVEKNDAKAYDLYRRAADLNHPTGMHNMAVLLDKGQGVRRDSEQAADLVMRAMRLKYEFSYKQMTTNSGTYSREFRAGIQRRLKDAGVYNGPLDGEFGQTTQAAITAYYNMKH